MGRLPRFALSSLLLATCLVAVTFGVAVNFGAFVLLLSAAVALTLSACIAFAHRLGWRRHNYPVLKPLLKLMMTYSVLVALYFASYGPATWLLAKTHTYDSRSPWMVKTHNRLYSPVTRCIVDSPIRTISSLGVAYLNWWLPSDVDLLYRGRNIDLISPSKVKPASAIVYGLDAPLIVDNG